MSTFLFGLVVGIVVGVIATTLVYRNNKKVQDKANQAVDRVKDRLDGDDEA
jgi:uncharacterized membrane-anchored protein YhcB (DUF1043 family)